MIPLALVGDSEGDQVIARFPDHVARDPGELDRNPLGFFRLVVVKNPVQFLKKFVLVVDVRDRE